MLHDPNVNSPANNEAARLYKENRREYEKKVAAVVQESWVEDEGDEVEDNIKDNVNDGEAPTHVDTMSSWCTIECRSNTLVQFGYALASGFQCSDCDHLKTFSYLCFFVCVTCCEWDSRVDIVP